MQRDFDLIHCHCPVTSAMLARALRDRIHVPLVFTYHTKFDIDIANAIKRAREMALLPYTVPVVSSRGNRDRG